MENKKGLFGVPFLPVRSWITPFVKLIYAMIAAPLFIYLGEKIIRGRDLYAWLRTYIGDFAFWMSSFVLFLAIVAISLLTTKLSVGVGIVGALAVLTHGIQYFKLKLRGEPFFPWDIYLTKEAADIVSDVKIEFTRDIWLAIGATVVLIIGAVVIDILLRYPKAAKYYFRLAASVIVCVGIVFFMNSVIFNKPLMQANGIQLKTWDEKWSYNNGGFFVTFMQNVENMAVKAPEGYSKENIEKITEGYTAKDGKTPNIICIMSEAFVDPDQWKNIGFKEEVTPTLESLKGNALMGKVLTPALGGNTSISEYEVLSGCASSFLPQGAIPYMQYVTKSTGCYYPAFLKELGYTTVAIHPYKASFWSRNTAYPIMGFDKFLTEEDFEDPTTYRWQKYISDMDLTEKIISEYESAKGDGPFFTFAVSMQNHASYAGSDYGENRLQTDKDYPGIRADVLGSAASYATGAKYADEALGVLIDYFKNADEETVIIFFGDHQPSIHDSATAYNGMLGLTSPENSAEMNEKLTYTTPYVIWNNFDTDIALEDGEVTDFSMYQLLPYMTKKLGLARPAYFEYLSDMRDTLPGHIATVALNPDGTAALQKTAEQQALADEHWIVQYDMTFGSCHAAEMWKPMK